MPRTSRSVSSRIVGCRWLLRLHVQPFVVFVALEFDALEFDALEFDAILSFSSVPGLLTGEIAFFAVPPLCLVPPLCYFLAV